MTRPNIIEAFRFGASRQRLVNEDSSQRTYFVWGHVGVLAEYTAGLVFASDSIS